MLNDVILIGKVLSKELNKEKEETTISLETSRGLIVKDIIINNNNDILFAELKDIEIGNMIGLQGSIDFKNGKNFITTERIETMYNSILKN